MPNVIKRDPGLVVLRSRPHLARLALEEAGDVGPQRERLVPGEADQLGNHSRGERIGEIDLAEVFRAD